MKKSFVKQKYKYVILFNAEKDSALTNSLKFPMLKNLTKSVQRYRNKILNEYKLEHTSIDNFKTWY